MKRIFLLIMLAFSLFGGIQAQTKTVTGVTPNKLRMFFNSSEYTTTTDLAISGTMNVQDFKFIRDTLKNVANLDLSNVTISALFWEQGGPFTGGATGIGTDKSNSWASYNADEIPAYAFQSDIYANTVMSTLKSIKLPKNLKSIGKYAFANNTGLTEISLPASVDSMGTYAFYLCKNLTTYGTLPAGLKTMEFAGCTSLPASIEVPEGVTKIDFSSNTTLTSIKLPESAVTIALSVTGLTSVTVPKNAVSFSFISSTSLQSVTFEEGVTQINAPSGAFANCSALSKVILPQSLRVIGNSTFSRCTNLTSIDIPQKVNTIGSQAFQYTGLTSFTAPDSLLTIGSSAFSSCTALSAVKLNEGLQSLSGFDGCTSTSLQEFTIPSTVKKITGYLFQGDTGIKKIYSLPVSVPTGALSNSYYGTFKGIDAVLYVPKGSLNSYKDDPIWYAAFGDDNMQEIDASAQTITGLASTITARKGTDQTVTLPAHTDQGLSVTYTIENGKENVATLSDNILTVVGEGTAQITVSQAGNGMYSAFSKTVTLTVVDYSYLKAAAIAVEGDTMRVVGPGASTFTKLYVNGTASTNGYISATGTVNLEATNADASKFLKLTVTHQASTSASAASRNAAATNLTAGRAAAEKSLRDAVNNSMKNSGK